MSRELKSDSADLHRLASLRALQQREAARGCLLALVLEGGAVLAVLLWLAGAGLEMPRLKLAAVGAFTVFTLAAAVVGIMILVQGNLPRQRRIRREHEEAIRRAQSADTVAGNDRAG